ncbi:MAG: hypothetical protein M0009_06940 [Deltaproteobacteria bacterium]|nr:hypothetical protein [Deltaproteobacteria bacterium]
MRPRRWIVVLMAALLLGIGIAARIVPSRYTEIVLTQEGREDALFRAIVPDGEPLTLRWRNSQFGLDVTEGFVARSGLIIQNRVTFALPGGPPPPPVSPGDVPDLFHTGGPFDARGLSRPFSRIVYRVGEIGDPRLQVQNRTVAFKPAAGFGGRITLAASRPAFYEILWFGRF